MVAKYVEALVCAATDRAPRSPIDEHAAAHFASVAEAIEEIRAGRMVVVCDSEDRENEGDLVHGGRSSRRPRRSTSWRPTAAA